MLVKSLLKALRVPGPISGRSSLGTGPELCWALTLLQLNWHNSLGDYLTVPKIKGISEYPPACGENSNRLRHKREAVD